MSEGISITKLVEAVKKKIDILVSPHTGPHTPLSEQGRARRKFIQATALATSSVITEKLLGKPIAAHADSAPTSPSIEFTKPPNSETLVIDPGLLLELEHRLIEYFKIIGPAKDKIDKDNALKVISDATNASTSTEKSANVESPTVETVDTVDINALIEFQQKLESMPRSFDMTTEEGREAYRKLYETGIVRDGYGPEWEGRVARDSTKPLPLPPPGEHYAGLASPDMNNLGGIPSRRAITMDERGMVLGVTQADEREKAFAAGYTGAPNPEWACTATYMHMPGFDRNELQSGTTVKIELQPPKNMKDVFYAFWLKPDFDHLAGYLARYMNEKNLDAQKISYILNAFTKQYTDNNLRAEIDILEHVVGRPEATGDQQDALIGGAHSWKIEKNEAGEDAYIPYGPWAEPRAQFEGKFGTIPYDSDGTMKIELQRGPEGMKILVNGTVFRDMPAAKGHRLFRLDTPLIDKDGKDMGGKLSDYLEDWEVPMRLIFNNAAGAKGWPPGMVPDLYNNPVGTVVKNLEMSANKPTKRTRTLLPNTMSGGAGSP